MEIFHLFVDLLISVLGSLIASIGFLPINVIVSLLSSLFGLVIVLNLERRKIPDLKIEKGEPTRNEKDNIYNDLPCIYLHVNVTNLRLSDFLARFWNRETAVACRGWITFYRYDDCSCVFDHQILARWSDTPSPEIPTLYKKQKILPKGLQETVDIQPVESKRLDIAVRFELDNKCFAWNNENYLYIQDYDTKYHHPKHQLEAGRYYVRIVVTSGGREFRELFKLRTDVPYDSFDLEPFDTKEQKAKVMMMLPECSAGKLR